MKTLIITLPAMGKTSLVKRDRNRAWSTSPGVDMDMKGLNSYNLSTTLCMTSLANTLLQREDVAYLTGFNGQFDLRLIDHTTKIYIVVPITEYAMQLAVFRSVARGDSSEFSYSYWNNIVNWTQDLVRQYNELVSLPDHPNVTLVGIRGAEVLTDIFKLEKHFGQSDCELSFDGYLRCFFTSDHFDLEISSGIGDFEDAICGHINTFIRYDDRGECNHDYLMANSRELLHFILDCKRSFSYVTIVLVPQDESVADAASQLTENEYRSLEDRKFHSLSGEYRWTRVYTKELNQFGDISDWEDHDYLFYQSLREFEYPEFKK